MKGLLLSAFLFLLSFLLSCNSPAKPGEPVSVKETADSCKANPENTYEVLIPESRTNSGKLPLLVIIDAHGGGKSALERFKPAAYKYPAVIVASNLVKNGYAGYEGAIRTLIEDARSKYPVSETIFIAGFSGGARMAIGYALNHRVNGLILCGAMASADQLNSLHCPVFAISGMDDFNFVETAQYLFNDQAIPQNLKIELTGASHNWPDSNTLGNAFGFLYLSGNNADIQSSDKEQLKKYNERQLSRIDSLEKAGDYVKAAQVARNLSSTLPFSNDRSFGTKYNEIKSGPGYADQLNSLEQCISLEMKIRQPYLEAFTGKDSIWWRKEISSLNDKIKTEKDPFTRDMYLRIKGFWGIASYSLGNQAVKEKNPEKLKKILIVYYLVEPENPYILYLSAFPYYWSGNNAKASELLKKALDAGFTEMDRLNADFPGIFS